MIFTLSIVYVVLGVVTLFKTCDTKYSSFRIFEGMEALGVYLVIPLIALWPIELLKIELYKRGIL